MVENKTLPEAAALTLWGATFLLLAIVPDQKILRYKLIAVEAGVASLAALVLARWVFNINALWHRTFLDIPVGLYTAGGFLFYLLSPERGASSLELTRTLFCALTFFAATQTIPLMKNRKTEQLLLFWVATAGLVGLYASLQWRGGVGLLVVPQSERPFVTFGNPIFLAAYLAAAVAAGVGVLSRGASPRSRILCLTGVALAAGGLLATQTRASYAGLGGTFAIAAVFSLKGQRRWIAVFIVAAGLAAVLSGFEARQWTHGLIWRDTLALWKDQPLFGCGLGRFHIEFPAYASDTLKALWPQRKVIINFAHNEYLQILAETGIVGFGLFLLIPVSGVLWLLHAKRDSPSGTLPGFSGSFALAAGVLLLQNFFSPDIRFGLSSFLLFFCLGAAVANSDNAGKPLPEFPGRWGLAFIGALSLMAWSRNALEPLLAQRHLSKEPSFHIPATNNSLDTLAFYEEKLAADPTNVDLAENIAYLYAKQKRWREAASRFELVARLDPTRPGPLNNLGNIYYSIGNKQKAIEYWKQSLGVK